MYTNLEVEKALAALRLQRLVDNAGKGNMLCFGAGPCEPGDVRVLPMMPGDSPHAHLLLCRQCFDKELAYRRQRNPDLPLNHLYDLPAWETLPVWGAPAPSFDVFTHQPSQVPGPRTYLARGVSKARARAITAAFNDVNGITPHGLRAEWEDAR